MKNTPHKPKDNIHYEFHGNHGWYTSSSHDLIKTDKTAIVELHNLRRQFNDNTIKAYRAVTRFEEIKE